MDKEITQMLQSESEQIRKLHEIVKKSIEDEDLIIRNLLNPPKEILTKGQRVSDKVARFGGSWAFIISFLIIMASWIAYNSTMVDKENFHFSFYHSLPFYFDSS